MVIKKLVIHNVDKELKQSAKLYISDELIDVSEEKTKNLINDLYSFFTRSIKYGIFDHNETSTFSTEFAELVKNNSLSNPDFLAFSKAVLNDLKVRMDSISQSKGGYIVFVELSNMNDDYIVVFVVRDKTGRNFKFKNHRIEIEEVIHVDTNKLAMACRINLSAYKSQEERYLSFLSTTQEDASQYFIKWVGAIAQKKSTEDTRNLRAIINRIGLPKDENGQEIPREKLRQCVYELCTKTYTNTVNLRTLAEELWHDADYLTRYAEENNIKINDQFDIDRDEIKKLNGYSVTGDSIKLAFPSEYMGKKVRFDKNNDDVIIIESKKLAERLKDELL